MTKEGIQGKLQENGEKKPSQPVHEVFKAFFELLKKSISNAENFRSSSHRLTFEEMTPQELEQFNQIFNLEEFILDEVREGSLVVADFEEVTDPLLENTIAILSDPYEDKSLSPKAITPYGQVPKFRVYTTEPNKTERRVPVYPFDPQGQGMKIYFRPHFHLGGQGRLVTGDPLYNAFIALDFIVTDKLGRLVVKDVWESFPGKGRIGSIDGQGNFVPLTGSEPVFHPYGAVDISVWFNTDIKKDEENILKVKHNLPDFFMLSAALHDENEIESMTIPDEPKVKLFFEIIAQYLNDKKDEQSSSRSLDDTQHDSTSHSSSD